MTDAGAPRSGSSGTGSDAGAVSSGLEASLRRALTVALMVWQVVVLAAVAVSETRWPTPALVAVHVVAIAACGLVLAGRLPFTPVLLALYGVWAVDYLACVEVDGALLLAACWLGNLLYAVAALTLPRPAAIAVPVLGAAAVGLVVTLGNPVWSVELSSTLVVTAAAIVVAGQLSMPTLRGLARSVDEQHGLAETQEAAREAARRASHEAAEDARVLHDTIVNTLAAAANGVRGERGREALRERCGNDARRVADLVAGRREADVPSLSQLDAGVAVRVEPGGLAGDELRRQEALLAPEVLRNLHGAASELLRNADRHAEASLVQLDVDRDGDRLQVTVTDDGRGFDPGSVERRGLDRSVRDRIEAVGGDLRVVSEVGRGTTVRLRVPLVAAAQPQAGSESGDPVDAEAEDTATARRILERAAWLWSASVLVVGFVIEAVNRPGQLTPTYLMLLLASLGSAALWVTTRVRRPAPRPLLAVLVLLLVPAFVAGMAGIDYGRTEVIYYQAIALTSLLVLLLTYGAGRALQAAVSLYVGAAVVLALVMAMSDPDAAVTVLVGATPAAGVVLGWVGFGRLVTGLVTQGGRERRSAARAAREVRARDEVVLARRRWRSAGLASSLDVLRGIAAGRLDADDPAVRDLCAQEEAYLRQLIQLSPDAYRMSVWFARALAESRQRDVRLQVRSGETDAVDEDEAALLGSVVVEAVAGARPGSTVVAGLFPAAGGRSLVVVGERASLASISSTARLTRLADQDVLEIELASGTGRSVS